MTFPTINTTSTFVKIHCELFVLPNHYILFFFLQFNSDDKTIMIIESIASYINLVNALLHQILSTSFFKLLNFYSFLHMLGCECGWYPFIINCELHTCFKITCNFQIFEDHCSNNKMKKGIKKFIVYFYENDVIIIS